MRPEDMPMIIDLYCLCTVRPRANGEPPIFFRSTLADFFAGYIAEVTVVPDVSPDRMNDPLYIAMVKKVNRHRVRLNETARVSEVRLYIDNHGMPCVPYSVEPFTYYRKYRRLDGRPYPENPREHEYAQQLYVMIPVTETKRMYNKGLIKAQSGDDTRLKQMKEHDDSIAESILEPGLRRKYERMTDRKELLYEERELFTEWQQGKYEAAQSEQEAILREWIQKGSGGHT